MIDFKLFLVVCFVEGTVEVPTECMMLYTQADVGPLSVYTILVGHGETC